MPQGLWLGGGGPGRAQGHGLGFVVLPQAELWWVHVDVVLAAELDGEAELGFVQADEDEGGFGDGLGCPVGGDQPGQLSEAAVAVAAGLALVEEVFGPELFEPGEVGVGVGTQPEGVAGGLHRGDVVVGVDEFHDLVVQLHQRDFGVAVAEQVAHDWALGHGLWRQPTGAFTSSPELLVDGAFGGAAAPFSTVAAAHPGSLAEHAGVVFWTGRRSALALRGFWGLQVRGFVRSQPLPRGMSLSCHDRPPGCGVELET